MNNPLDFLNNESDKWYTSGYLYLVILGLVVLFGFFVYVNFIK